MTARIVMHVSRVKRPLDTIRRQCWKYNITRFFIAEDRTGYFSSVFTRELQVPDAKFQKAKSEYFGKIIVTI